MDRARQGTPRVGEVGSTIRSGRAAHNLSGMAGMIRDIGRAGRRVIAIGMIEALFGRSLPRGPQELRFSHMRSD